MLDIRDTTLGTDTCGKPTNDVMVICILHEKRANERDKYSMLHGSCMEMVEGNMQERET